MYQRQLAKQGLSAAIVDDTAAQSRTFSQEELRALFKVGGGGGRRSVQGRTPASFSCALGFTHSAHTRQTQCTETEVDWVVEDAVEVAHG